MYKLKTSWTQNLFTPFTADLFLLPDNNKGLNQQVLSKLVLKTKDKEDER